MIYLVTGALGFIGSNLCESLLKDGHIVYGVDRLAKRHQVIRKELERHYNFKFYDADLRIPGELHKYQLHKIDAVFHLAANADVRFSSVYPEKDLDDGILATFYFLQWVWEKGINKIVYASTSAIYGDAKVIPTPETYFPIQTSFYGASKLAGEAMLQAHCAAYNARAWIFRFGSITGPRYSHGFIYNFYSELKKDPRKLYVHGGKEQRKTYLDVEDCVRAIRLALNTANDTVNIFNLGNTETIGLEESIPIICNHMKVNPTIVWSGNEVGWIGDSKINDLDVTKILDLGWKPKYTIKESIVRTLTWLDKNQWILDYRQEI